MFPSAFDRLDLATDTPDPGQHLVFFPRGAVMAKRYRGDPGHDLSNQNGAYIAWL